MSARFEYFLNKATMAQINYHLRRCDTDFLPPLSNRINIDDYSLKINNKAIRFEAWSTGKLIGMVAVYCNDTAAEVAHITSVSVLKEWQGNRVAHLLINKCIEYARNAGMEQVALEVAKGNLSAITLYEKNGFVVTQNDEPTIHMKLYLNMRSK